MGVSHVGGLGGRAFSIPLPRMWGRWASGEAGRSEGAVRRRSPVRRAQALRLSTLRRMRSFTVALAWCVIVMLGASCSDDPTPWERFRDGYNAQRLTNVIGDQALFVAVFNHTYESLNDCGTAYVLAVEAQSNFREMPEDIIAAGEQAEQEYYDEKVAAFMAAEEWLKQHGCPGAWDFFSI